MNPEKSVFWCWRRFLISPGRRRRRNPKKKKIKETIFFLFFVLFFRADSSRNDVNSSSRQIGEREKKKDVPGACNKHGSAKKI